GGTTINSVGQGPATLRAAASNALGTGAVSTGPAGNGTTGRLELVGNITLPNAITFAGRNSLSNAIENVSGNNTLSGTLSVSTGGGNYWIQSDAGTLNLSGAAGGGGAITAAATGTRTVTLRG